MSLPHSIGQNSPVHSTVSFLTVREAGKESNCVLRKKRQAWSLEPGERMVGIGPGVGDGLCWLMHPLLPSGPGAHKFSSLESLAEIQLVLIHGPFRSGLSPPLPTHLYSSSLALCLSSPFQPRGIFFGLVEYLWGMKPCSCWHFACF